MSLINDALKRASESDKNRPAQAPLPRPMQLAPPPPRSSDLPAFLMAAAIVAVLGIGVSGWLFLASRTAAPPIVATVPAQLVTKSIAVPPAPIPQPSPVVQKTLPPPIIRSPPALLVAPPETFPTNLTVKAIFYNKTNPRALVNGKTVETGDKIGDVLVTGIMSDRVFLDWKGQSKVLMMGGQ